MNSLLLENSDSIRLLALVRTLPGRREVYRAEWREQSVFVKVFLGTNSARYAQRDAQGAQWMLAAGLTTPELLWQGKTADQRSQVLIYAAVAGALNAADEYVSSDNGAAKLSLLQKLVIALAAQHSAGLCQTDLHLKNFLLANGQVWAIDGDGIRQQSLSVKKAHLQLAELISKLHVLDQQGFVQNLLNCYLQARGWTKTVDAQQVFHWAKRMKAKEVEAYVRFKIFRNCSDVRWQANTASAQAVSVVSGLNPVDVADLESSMLAGKALKRGNTCTVVSSQLQNQAVVIKRYNIKNYLHAVSRAWRPSRAAASWSNAHRLQYYDFLTPQPLLMLESRYFGLRGKAFFVSTLSPYPDALHFFQQTPDSQLRAEAVQQLTLTCYQFYLLKIAHGDLKATNLQVDPQGKIIVMDLDSMRQYSCARRALRAHVKDIRRLLQNWKDDTSLYNALVKSFQAVYADTIPLKLAGISI